jgi:hypothetical protein
MLPDLFGPEIELRGEGVVSRAAEGEVRRGVRAPMSERHEMMELELMSFAATLATPIHVRATRSIALEHDAPDACGDVAGRPCCRLRRPLHTLRRRLGRAEPPLFEPLHEQSQRSQLDLLDSIVLPAVR